MINTAKAQPHDDEDAAELAALRQAVAEADNDPRTVDQKEMLDWLQRLANGDFNAPPPTSRQLPPH